MSSYVVEDIVINAVVNYLKTDWDGNWARSKLKDMGYDLQDETLTGCIRLAQAMHDLNDCAVNERYSDHPAEEFQPFIFRRMSDIEHVPVLKALSCWLYQCSEGDVPQDLLYKFMDKIRDGWAMAIIHDMADYEKAAWGYEEHVAPKRKRG